MTGQVQEYGLRMMSQLRGSQNYVWSVTDVLGQGATGSVFKCRHKKTGELFAVKTFNSVSHLRPADIQMRELEVLQKLSHENIVQLHAIEEEAYVHSRVLIMDLCTGGSLFSILDDPENAYGLDETEFLCVLRDVAAGMKHLRDNGVVHRDIKPGNIMRYITDDGRSVYKLIDFGAARQLQDEEQFVSLYGTEEYLYPDMYERAVLKRPSCKQFTAAVDLWSIGVTLYHIATGQLPFRPFGGSRRNKELMHEITTAKPPGAISGVQHTEGCSVEYSDQLPQSCQLSRGVKRLITPLLAGLLANETDQVLSFEAFFMTVQQIVSNNVVYVFHVASCSLLHIYLPVDSRLAQLHEAITAQTNICADDQFVLFESHDLHDVVRDSELLSLVLCTCPSNPLYLFSVTDDVDSAALLSADSVLSATVPTLPANTKDSSADVHLDSDALFVKNCCAIVYCHRRLVADLLREQQLLVKAAKMYRLVLEHEVTRVCDDFKKFGVLVKEIGNRIDLLSRSYSMHLALFTELSALKNIALHDMPTSLTDAFTRQNECYSKLTQQVEWINKQMVDVSDLLQLACDGSTSSLDSCRCPQTDNCTKKAEMLVKALRKTLSDFSRDRSLKRLSFNEEQIHKFDRHKAKQNTSKSTLLIQEHCLPNTRQMFDKFTAWYKLMQTVQKQLEEVKNQIGLILSEQEVLSESLDEIQAECTAKLQSSLKQLGVTVQPTSTCDTASSLSTSVGNTRVMAANGEFVFRTRHRKLIQKLTHSLAMNSQQMAALRNIVEDNEKYLQFLRSPSKVPRPPVDTSAGRYLELDDVADTLQSDDAKL